MNAARDADAAAAAPPVDLDLAVAVFSDYPDGLLVVAPPMLTIIAANRTACNLLGYTPDEFRKLEITAVESSIENLFYWDDARNGYFEPVELRDGFYQRRDGSVVAVQKRIGLLPTAQGTLLLITFQENASDQSMRDELSMSSSLLAATLEATADGILVARLDGSISNMNRRFAQMWQIPDTVIDTGSDRKIYAFMQSQAKDPAEYARVLDEATQNTDGDSLDVLELNNGRILERYATPLQSDGQVAGFVFCFRDVTERQQHATALEAKNLELEKANCVKTEFLANMSHEIRTPMNAIIGLSRLCLRTDLNPQQRDYVEKIFRSGESLLGIINDVLDFSKIEAGKLSMESIPFQLSKVFERLGHLTKGAADEKHLALTFDTQFSLAHVDVGETLVGDPLRLGQVLLNLVSNAIKFTEQGGVAITVRELNVTEQTVDLQFSVTDTGIGMTKEQLSRMFQSFTQADASTTRKYGGTGLGLAICKSLVEMMSGTIAVDSEPNVGSTFTFTAKFGRAARDTLPPPDEQSDAGYIPSTEELRGACVLLVEDNRINQQIARELLAQWGVACVIAQNGLEGIAILEQRSFDAVLMDLQMPVMDGFEATLAIRAKPQYAKLPIIAMTANAMVSDERRCIDAGMNAHVPKPIDPEQLVKVLCKWIAPGPRAAVELPPTAAPGGGRPISMRLPHIDLDAALKSAGGNYELVRSLLLLFWGDHRNDVAELRSALNCDDHVKAQRIVHTIKGIAGSIGAQRLQTVAKELEAEMRNQPGTCPPEQLASFSNAFAEVIVGLAVFAKSAESKSATLEAAPTADKSTKPRILIVDDEPMIVTILSAILKNDYEIASAASGNQALAAAAKQPPALILLDVTMPDMDGYEVCAKLKSDAATRNIPVIFVSGLDSAEDRTRGMTAGAVDYLLKPIKRDAVSACVRKHLSAG